MGTFFYYLLVYPIEFLIEFIFALVYQMIGSLGYSIIAVSLAISFLVLPLYKRSDAIQEEERRQQEKLASGVTHIRRTFRGDERTMLLSAYYRQNGYRPFYALRGSISLLLQIPFFMAAYHYLSNLSILEGSSFHSLKDLGAPDGMLAIGGLAINVLPILMTVINILSGAIYTKGFPLKQKLQLYGIALVFLVLLYGSPSGLVLYWTMNNMFSLVKNIFMKRLRNPKRVFAWTAAGAGILFGTVMWLRGKLYTADIAVFTILVMVACCIPMILQLTKKQEAITRQNRVIPCEEKGMLGFFLLVSSALTVIPGALIPITVVGSSPTEF